MEVKVTLPDGSVEEYEKGTTVAQIAASIGKRLAKAAIVGKVNDKLVDLNYPVEEDCRLEIITETSPEALSILRHSTSHIMAQAVKSLFPEAKLAIGPAIEDGFYYDFDVILPFTPEDLAEIEEKMREIVEQNLPFSSKMFTKDEAKKFFAERGEKYKIELLEDIPDEEVPIYKQGDFADLCLGPHIPSTGKAKAFKLLNVAGAYWRGDEKREMLQRIYGTVYSSQKDLDDHLHRLEEAKRRDHRKLGRDLDIYSIHEEVGAGLIHWHPKGAMIRTLIEDFWKKEHFRRGYDLVYTPHIASEKIYAISGHLENYLDSMYSAMDIEGSPYRMKPMNCPGHIMIYQTKTRSYRDLPIRLAELGTVYRYERSGTLHGMLRVRGFTQDDSHIFCTPDQLVKELVKILELVDFMMATFGYRYQAFLSTRPEKSIGSDEVWEMATNALKEALRIRDQEYEIDPGAGIFYGPKIDIKIVDALGRGWQGPTIQVDFNLPERFDVTYIGEDNERHRVVMVHRTVLGSMERFIGGLIEHYAGAFPTWLSPIQVRVIPIADRHLPYASKVRDMLFDKEVRVELDDRSESVSFKIRSAQLEKLPYMLIIGDREVEHRTVAVRRRDERDLGAMKLDSFSKQLEEEIESRARELKVEKEK